MGNRTVVVLYTDQTHEWSKDPLLGQKIATGQNACYMSRSGTGSDLHYGMVVECSHADTQTLAVLDGYTFSPIVHSSWYQGQKFKDVQDSLLKAWAEERGYRLVKKPTKE